MSKLNLLFFFFALLAVSTASYERNLRFLGAENERELESSTSDENESSGSTANTTPEVTTTKASDEPTTTTSSQGGESTTTEPTEKTTPEVTTTTPSGTGGNDDIPTVPATEFRCYVKEAPLSYDSETGFKVTNLLCNIPEASGSEEATTTPAEASVTASAAAARMLVEPAIEVVIEGKGLNNVKCAGNKAAELTCGTEGKGFNIKDYRFTAVYNGFESVVYLGCRMGDSDVIPVDGNQYNGTSCPAPLVKKGEDEGYNATCKFYPNKIGTGDEYQVTTGNISCKCSDKYSHTDSKSHKYTYDIPTSDIGVKDLIGSTYTVDIGCKTGQLKIKCKSTGWEVVSGEGECLNDGAVTSTVSAILLSVIMVIAIML